MIELFKSKLLDVDIAKIVAPLRKDKVDTAALSARDEDGLDVIVPAIVTSGQKDFFQPPEQSATTTSKPVSLDGHLISLNKDSNRGTFRMQNGKSVRYHFKGGDEASFYGDFSSKGVVRVQCTASFDEALELKSIDITATERLQGVIGFLPPSDGESPQ